MSDASAVASTSFNWIQRLQNDPAGFAAKLDDVLDQFGLADVSNAFTQSIMEKLVGPMREMINDSEFLPDAVKDKANEVLDNFMAELKHDCPCSGDVVDAVTGTEEWEALSEAMEAEVEAMGEYMNEWDGDAASCCEEGTGTEEAPAGSEASEEATTEAQTEAENEGTVSDPGAEAAAAYGNSEIDKEKSKSGNWLVALAERMSEIQSKFLDAAMAASETMATESENAVVGDGEGSGQSAEFLRAQGHFTANMQLFNIFATQTSTALKTLGEAAAATGRKQ